MMKRSMKIIISTISCIVIFGCTSIPENNEGFSLDDAIYEAALKISSELPQGERIAVINFDSFEMELSRYIMEEITCRLVIERKLTVIERSGIELLNKELNFQASGYVSDESAQGIGKMVGAESIVIGNIINTGKNYRFYIRVIGIESAVNRCSYIADVSDDQEFMALLAAVKDGSKRADESYKEIQRVRLPITAMEHLDRGRVFIELNEIDLALEFLTKAIQIDQNLDLAYYWRGIVYWLYTEQDDAADKAINDFTNAIRINPNMVLAYAMRGFVYERGKKDYTRALADYNRVITLDPNHPGWYIERAWFFEDIGDLRSAIDDYDKAIRLSLSKFDLYYYNLSKLYIQCNDSFGAITNFTELIELIPDFYYSYFLRGDMYYETKEYPLAISDYSQAIDLNPGFFEAYINRGWAYYVTLNQISARLDWENALRIIPNENMLRRQDVERYLNMLDK